MAKNNVNWKTVRLVITVVCIFISLNAKCQANMVYGDIVVKSDPVVQVGKEFRISYSFNSKDSTEKIVSPTWNWDMNNNYDILMGPSHATQSSTTFVNGKKSISFGETYMFLLSFKKEGLFTLPSMSAKTSSGKELKSKSIKVRVINQDRSSTDASDTPFKPSKEELLVMEVSVNKNRIELGDSVECEIRLYTKMNIAQIGALTPLSINRAFWKEIELPKEKSFELCSYKGDSVVNTVLWRKMSIIPIQSGIIRIEPMKFLVTIMIRNLNVDTFEALINGQNAFNEKDTIIMTNPITIQVDNKQIASKEIEIETCSPKHSLGIVIDRSSSLLCKPDSISASFSQLENQFIEEFLKGKSSSDYSLTFFAGKPHFPSLTELKSIHNIIPTKENNASAIYDAILASAIREGALTTERSPYSILLLTDGFDNASRLSEKMLTDILLKHKIRVDVVAFASKKDSIYYVLNDSVGGFVMKNNQDFSDVERIAKATNGQFVLVENKKQIPAAIHQIKKKIMEAEAPKCQQNKDFKPVNGLLYRLYKEVMLEARTTF